MNQKNNLVSRASERINHLAPFANSHELLGTRIVDAYTSSYLIPINRSEQDFILIDTGFNKQAKAIKRELARRQLGTSALKMILITHPHADHTRGRNGLDLDIPTYVGMEDIPVILGQKRSQGHMPRIGERFGFKASVPGLTPIPYEHGLVSRIGDLSIETIGVEGHTSGSSSIIVKNILSGMVNAHVGDLVSFSSDGSARNAPERVSHDVNMNHESIIEFHRFMTQRGYTDENTFVVPSHSGHGTLSAVRDYLDLD